jgi:hypothetical protein
MCAIVPIEDFELLERFENERDLKEALEENKDEETISHEKMKDHLDL